MVDVGIDGAMANLGDVEGFAFDPIVGRKSAIRAWRCSFASAAEKFRGFAGVEC